MKPRGGFSPGRQDIARNDVGQFGFGRLAVINAETFSKTGL
jgi:hypothetical protein